VHGGVLSCGGLFLHQKFHDHHAPLFFFFFIQPPLAPPAPALQFAWAIANRGLLLPPCGPRRSW
jgi:hypothetical protein